MNRTHPWYFMGRGGRPSSIVGVGLVPTLHRLHRPFQRNAARPSSIVGVGLVPTLHRLHRPYPAGLLALLAACAAVFLTALDQTVVVTALPQIITDLQIPIFQLDHAAWIVSGSLLGYVIAMP